MSWRVAINWRRSWPLPATLTPVHSAGMLGSWSRTLNLVVSICLTAGANVELADFGEIIFRWP